MISRSRLIAIGLGAAIAFLAVGCTPPELAGGKLYFSQKLYDQALEQFQAAVDGQPNNGEAHLWLARAFAELDRDEEAIREIEAATQLAPELSDLIGNTRESYWSARFNRGIFYAGEADDQREFGDSLFTETLQLAVDRFERAILFCPDSVRNYTNLGKVLFQKGDREKAMPHFATARRMGQNRPQLQQFLLAVYRTLGIEGLDEKTPEGYRRALDMFSEAASFDQSEEDRATIYFNMALASSGLAGESDEGEKMSLLQQAVDYYQRVIEVDAHDLSALGNLAQVYGGMDEKGKAIEVALAILDIEPWGAQHHIVLARYLNANDERDRGAAHTMLYECLKNGHPEPLDKVRQTATSKGPGSDMLKTLRDRGEPEQIYIYSSGSRGDFEVWFYWQGGRVFVFNAAGRDVFSFGFAGVSAEKAREIIGE